VIEVLLVVRISEESIDHLFVSLARLEKKFEEKKRKIESAASHAFTDLAENLRKAADKEQNELYVH
jgi:predicted nuclease with TOPRIM domain